MSEPEINNSSPIDWIQDPRKRAAILYWQGFSISLIADLLSEKANTIYSWKRRDQWDEKSPLERVDLITEARLIQLIAKPKKEGIDFKEIDLLGRQMERNARINKFNHGGNEADLNPNIAKRNANIAQRKVVQTNEINESQIEKLQSVFLDGLYEHQKIWWRNSHQRIRNIVKSRQIGATLYFSQEAFIDAITTGRNQIFLSASKAQAFQSRQYIVDFARNADIELRGDVIFFPHNEARLYFLGTNSRTAQSYHGNLILDEYFWIHRFLELRKVAAGMASQNMWRQTYLSTPSSITHEAYKFWSGQLVNKGRNKKDQFKIDISHEALKWGLKCDDGQWRQIVTIEDAINQGYDRFNIEDLMLENSPDEFAQLFMCLFIDDTESIFPLSMMQQCMVDSWEVWDDFKPFAIRPLADKSVWIGYDPALDGDSAAMAVISPPDRPGGKFRIIEKHYFKGSDFEAQAKEIKKVTERFNVTYIGIDQTGMGTGVYQLVKQFFPAVQGFTYSPEVKQLLVLKGQSVIGKKRLEFDAGWSDVAQAFMSIRKTLTRTGKKITYESDRNEEVSHADIAWAVLHALVNEPLESNYGAVSTRSRIELFD